MCVVGLTETTPSDGSIAVIRRLIDTLTAWSPARDRPLAGRSATAEALGAGLVLQGELVVTP
ncbi:hypothetical protein GCM10009555_080100 [Acrocarpospora macrocephala]|uniref:Uncharacterized protein n=1 Tax=Acrocarpospora macrocephala TaxID=150177 RepID=A0A5M3WSC1_9ACTN|nr:hypothetical protein Amac_038080 [Acrocarpospora macrocephala]